MGFWNSIFVIFAWQYIRIHPASPFDKTDRDLCQKRWYQVWKSNVFIRNKAFSWFYFLCFCYFLISMYRVCLNGVDLSEFVKVHCDIAEIGKKVFFMQIVKILLIASWNSKCRVKIPYSRTLYKLQLTFWIFFHPSFMSCVVLNLLPFPKKALDQKLSFIFSELSSMDWTL